MAYGLKGCLASLKDYCIPNREKVEDKGSLNGKNVTQQDSKACKVLFALFIIAAIGAGVFGAADFYNKLGYMSDLGDKIAVGVSLGTIAFVLIGLGINKYRAGKTDESKETKIVKKDETTGAKKNENSPEVTQQ